MRPDPNTLSRLLFVYFLFFLCIDLWRGIKRAVLDDKGLFVSQAVAIDIDLDIELVFRSRRTLDRSDDQNSLLTAQASRQPCVFRRRTGILHRLGHARPECSSQTAAVQYGFFKQHAFSFRPEI